jgi:hypothetical protein
MFIAHPLSFETLRENLAPFPHYITYQENVQKNQAFATGEAILSS